MQPLSAVLPAEGFRWSAGIAERITGGFQSLRPHINITARLLHRHHIHMTLQNHREVGMDGARGIDLSMLKGNRMVNLDSEEEGIFLTSCAGGARGKCQESPFPPYPVKRQSSRCPSLQSPEFPQSPWEWHCPPDRPPDWK